MCFVILISCCIMYFFLFLNDPPPTEIYTLSLHDALPISTPIRGFGRLRQWRAPASGRRGKDRPPRSEEHTSELQSRLHLVCRLLLEKKKPRPQPFVAYTKNKQQN